MAFILKLLKNTIKTANNQPVKRESVSEMILMFYVGLGNS